MSKLSTKDVKALITTWFATPEARTFWECAYGENHFYRSFDEWKKHYVDDPSYLGLTAKQFEAMMTREDFSRHLVACATNGNMWNRGEKMKVGAENGWQCYFEYECKWTPEPINESSRFNKNRNVYITDVVGSTFKADDLGWSDEVLVKELCAAGTKELDRCIERIFYPKVGHIANNYRLHVVTDPTDTRVVGWSLNVD
jgi:hypothetical protein